MKSGKRKTESGKKSKCGTPSSFILHPSSFPTRGAALLIALTFLVLLSAVVLALFSSSRTDRQNAAAFTSGQETMRLADTAVNLVQGQIRDASIQPRVAWASQPGMVRTFDTSGTVTAYKLYSSDQMIVPSFGQAQITAESTAMQNWNNGTVGKSFNALYADLNAPAVVKRPDPTDTTKLISTPVFPIADPAALDTDASPAVSTGAVEGFTATTAVAGTTIATNDTRRLPMPVKWIYVLRDGQLIAPSGGSATSATFSGTVPSQDNPIVGRIAFWTDDDTCKLNINTASEGTFWDAPKASTLSDVRMAISMPVQGEFQRIVGHPATTSLSPILSSLSTSYTKPTSLIDSGSIATAVSNPDSYYGTLANYYALNPRIAGSTGSSDKSSKGGAQRTSAIGRQGTSEETTAWPASDQSNLRKGAPLLPDADRLYATPDEFLFKPDRTTNLDFTADFLSKRTFFLTAVSRAPETTLFGTPRISIWPQQAQASDRNVKDKLMNFCASVGKDSSSNPYTYSFQRAIASAGLFSASQPADSPTSDIGLTRNQNLIGYLQKLGGTSVPGYGGSFSSKWGGSGLDKIIAQTFDTVRASINTDYATLGNCTYTYSVTTRDPRTKITPQADGRIVDNFGGARNGVAPAKLSSTARGMGRTATISQVSLVLMASKVRNTYTSISVGNATWSGTETCDGESAPIYSPALPGGATILPGSPTPTAQQTLEVRALLLFQPYVTSQGPPYVVPAGQISISGLNSISIGTSALGPGGNVSTRFGAFTGSFGGYITRSGVARSLGSPAAFSTYSDGTNLSIGRAYNKEVKSGGSDQDKDYPFVSPPIDVTGSSTVTIGSGTLNVTLKSWAGDTIQTLTVAFPGSTVVVPQHIDQTAKFTGGDFTAVTFPRQAASLTTFKSGDYLSVRKRFLGAAGTDDDLLTMIRPGDIVRSVEWDPTDTNTRGDFRLLALDGTPATFREVTPGGNPAAYSGTGPSSANTSSAVAGRFATSLRTEDTELSTAALNRQSGWVASGVSLARRNTLTATGNSTVLAGLSFDKTSEPIIPSGLAAALMKNNKTGDWQSGIGQGKDGAFFPRPDSGNSNLTFGGYFGFKDLNLATGGETFEPNRQVPSAGILGSLMTCDLSGALQPWQTLLFSPRPAAGTKADHPGSASPADHAWLDNFWMPAVEPFPISEPLSTAGKVNLNFQMLPFTHIKRSTALRGALAPLMVSGVLDTLSTAATTYKGDYHDPATAQIRFEVNRDETVSEFEKQFANGDIYRSATQVCESSLVPTGTTASGLNAWWNSRRITSDTLREQPYTALLGRVTTKSNTYTVHYRVQALRQPPRAGRNWAEWDEAKDQVTGEYRGSTTIERFLDPNAPNIPDYTTVNLSGTYDPIDKWYRWRVLSQNQFAP